MGRWSRLCFQEGNEAKGVAPTVANYYLFFGIDVKKYLLVSAACSGKTTAGEMPGRFDLLAEKPRQV